MTKRLCLSRHGQVVNNVLGKLIGTEVFLLAHQELSDALRDAKRNDDQKRVQWIMRQKGFLHEKRISIALAKIYLERSGYSLEAFRECAGKIYDEREGDTYEVDILASDEEESIPLDRLTGRGRQQAKVLGDGIRKEIVSERSVVLTSSKVRTVETAEIALGRPMISDGCFDEDVPLEYVLFTVFPDELQSQFGTIGEAARYAEAHPKEALKFIDSYKKKYPELQVLKVREDALRQTLQSIGRRMCSDLEERVRRFPDSDVVGIFHGNVNTAFLSYIGAVDVGENFREFHFSNCALCVLEYDGNKFSVVKPYRRNEEL